MGINPLLASQSMASVLPLLLSQSSGATSDGSAVGNVPMPAQPFDLSSLLANPLGTYAPPVPYSDPGMSAPGAGSVATAPSPFDAVLQKYSQSGPADPTDPDEQKLFRTVMDSTLPGAQRASAAKTLNESDDYGDYPEFGSQFQAYLAGLGTPAAGTVGTGAKPAPATNWGLPAGVTIGDDGNLAFDPNYDPRNPYAPFISGPPPEVDPYDLQHTLQAVRDAQARQHQANLDALGVPIPQAPTGMPSKGVIPWLGLGTIIAQALAGPHSNVGSSILGGFLQGTQREQQADYQNQQADAQRQKALFLENARLAGVDAQDALQAYNLSNQEAAATATGEFRNKQLAIQAQNAQTNAGIRTMLAQNKEASDAQKAFDTAKTPAAVLQAGKVLQQIDAERKAADSTYVGTAPSDDEIRAAADEIPNRNLQTAMKEWGDAKKQYLNPYQEINDTDSANAEAQAQAIAKANHVDRAALGVLPTGANLRAAEVKAQTALLNTRAKWLPQTAAANIAKGLAEVKVWNRRAGIAQQNANTSAANLAMRQAQVNGGKVNAQLQSQIGKLSTTLAGQAAQLGALADNDPNRPIITANIAATKAKIDQLRSLMPGMPSVPSSGNLTQDLLSHQGMFSPLNPLQGNIGGGGVTQLGPQD